jgi:hypothetical protein
MEPSSACSEQRWSRKQLSACSVSKVSLLMTSRPNLPQCMAALAPLILENWRQRFLLGRSSLCDGLRSGRPFTNNLAKATASMLQKRSFLQNCLSTLSHCERNLLANFTRVARNEKCPLRWVPHALGANCKAEGMIFPISCLPSPRAIVQ